jgi:sialidase-1
MLTDSADRGRTWSPKRPLTEGTAGKGYYYNCARITRLGDGRLAVVVDQCLAGEGRAREDEQVNWLYFSADEGQTWGPPVATPARGIVPDKLLELESGRWILSAHRRLEEVGFLMQRLWYSDDQGRTWAGPVTVGRQEGLNLCEVSILPLGDRTLVAFHRENSGEGRDCYKTISRDEGESWSEPIRFPLPGCHRPVAGWLQDGRILITYRFMQGGKGWLGTWTQNFFAALTDRESALALTRSGAWTRILPVDFDRSPASDLGYSGWVQFDDGEIYIVNYIVDDAPKAQIRGYALRVEEFLLPGA